MRSLKNPIWFLSEKMRCELSQSSSFCRNHAFICRVQQHSKSTSAAKQANWRNLFSFQLRKRAVKCLKVQSFWRNLALIYRVQLHSKSTFRSYMGGLREVIIFSCEKMHCEISQGSKFLTESCSYLPRALFFQGHFPQLNTQFEESNLLFMRENALWNVSK